MGEEFTPAVCKNNLHLYYCRFKIMPVHLARLKHFRFVNVHISSGRNGKDIAVK